MVYKSDIILSEGDVLARLLGQRNDPTNVGNAVLLGRRWWRAPAPVHGHGTRTLSKQQLDHLLTYWASGRHKVMTATVRATLFVDHLKVRLSTDPIVEQGLRDVFGSRAAANHGALTTLTAIAEASLKALKNAQVNPNTEPVDGRYGVGLLVFGEELADTFMHIVDQHAAQLIRKVGRERMKDAVIDALQAIAFETQLADQMRNLAQSILAMKDRHDNGIFPDEDHYEMRLRHELFVSDLQLYTRLTRAAIEQVRVIGKTAASKAPRPHHTLAPLFSPFANPMPLSARVAVQ
jgi:hypothetical protein